MMTPEMADSNGHNLPDDDRPDSRSIHEDEDMFEGEGLEEGLWSQFDLPADDVFDELDHIVYFDSQADLEIDDPPKLADGHQTPASTPAKQQATESGKDNGHELRPASKYRSVNQPSTFGNDVEMDGLVEIGDGALLCSATMLEDLELMDALARAAVRAKSSTTAQGLAAAMIPLSIRLHQDVYRALWPALPVLTRGIMRITQKLYHDRARRSRIGDLPVILNNTTTQLAQRVAHGNQPLTSRSTARILARQVRSFLNQGSSRTRGINQEDPSSGGASYRGWDDN